MFYTQTKWTPKVSVTTTFHYGVNVAQGSEALHIPSTILEGEELREREEAAGERADLNRDSEREQHSPRTSSPLGDSIAGSYRPRRRSFEVHKFEPWEILLRKWILHETELTIIERSSQFRIGNLIFMLVSSSEIGHRQVGSLYLLSPSVSFRSLWLRCRCCKLRHTI
jgi:hypothetical protein